MVAGRKNKLIESEKRNIWHPFTQMADWVNDDPSAPLIIETGKGIYLYDIDGRKYIDGVSSLWVNLHGHRKKEIDSAVKKQVDRIAHSTFLGLTHEPAIKLAEELIKIVPKGLTRVFYSDNGSTSVEIALKMAYQYCHEKQPGSKKNSFLSLKNAYHGDTIGSVSVGGMGLFHSIFKPLLFKNYFAPTPHCYRCGKRRNKNIPVCSNRDATFKEHCRIMQCSGECLLEVEIILKKNSLKIAAAIIEPMVQGAGGMITMPPGYLKGFEKLCRKYKVLLICDEVATGFGRTGKMFSVEHENVRPDIICLSKGITGGYIPLAATIASENIYRGFLGKYEEFKAFFHGHSYTANPLGCAAALASLEVFRKENVLSELPEKIEHFKNELLTFADLPYVGEIRQIGLMAGIELVKNKITGEDFPAKEKLGARICEACRTHGLIIRPLGNVLVLLPPLCISKTEISRITVIVKKAISSMKLK